MDDLFLISGVGTPNLLIPEKSLFSLLRLPVRPFGSPIMRWCRCQFCWGRLLMWGTELTYMSEYLFRSYLKCSFSVSNYAKKYPKLATLPYMLNPLNQWINQDTYRLHWILMQSCTSIRRLEVLGTQRRRCGCWWWWSRFSWPTSKWRQERRCGAVLTQKSQKRPGRAGCWNPL